MNKEPDLKTREELINIFNSKRFSELIKKILNLQKNYPQSLFLLNLIGNTNNELENYNEAIINFKNIIKINSNFADAYYNLGIIYKKINLIDKSIDNYYKCIKINSKKYEAYNNLGNIFKDKLEIESAIKNYLYCLEINPDYKIALQNLGVCLQNFKFTKSSSVTEKHIINLLEQNKILRPVDIVKSLINYLYLDKKFNSIIENYKINYSLDRLLDEFLNFKILIKLLEITPITDIKIENILRYLRYKILLNITEIKNKNIASKVMGVIASQCYINEYVYPVKKKEEEVINKIEQKINNKKDNKFKNIILEISCLAAYKPLESFDWSNKIKDNKEISNLIKQQILNPNKERDIKKKLHSKKIKNLVSIKVKEQYENNPYPRWEKIALNNIPRKPIKFFKNLNLNINEEHVKDWNQVNVLVAGCGTGQHAITTATKYTNSFVTAIDLSLNSLSFAKRKAQELGIENIDFIQMDLLDLQYYEKQFDIIESVGVLHHMDKPYEGWKILYNILNTNGLMMIGLYSKLAREHIERTRNKIKNLEIEINDKNIINLREEIINSDTKDNKLIKLSPDFYSLSSLRDLLFHIQEHRFNINEIKNFLEKINLKFCGFENKELINLYKDKYNNKNDLYDLKLWHEFETKNPRIFAGMYQFWCQKIKTFDI